MRKRLTVIIVGIAALALGAVGLASMATGAVTGNAEDGWFVGKGDVQTALGMNNGALQNAVNSDALEFAYSDNVIVEGGACLHTEGNNAGQPHQNDVWRRTTGLNVTVVYEARKKNQVSGFFLDPAGSGTPVYTDSCGGNRVPDAGQIIATVPGDGLTVNGVPLE